MGTETMSGSTDRLLVENRYLNEKIFIDSFLFFVGKYCLRRESKPTRHPVLPTTNVIVTTMTLYQEGLKPMLPNLAHAFKMDSNAN